MSDIYMVGAETLALLICLMIEAPWEASRLNEGPALGHEGNHSPEMIKIWRQQPHSELERAVLARFAEEDDLSTIRKGPVRWQHLVPQDMRTLKPHCEMLGKDAHGLSWVDELFWFPLSCFH